jgi:beta-glucosidase
MTRTAAELDSLLDQLTLAELAGLLGGSDVWHTTEVKRLGIPQLRVTDGPAGARGTSFTGKDSVNVPCGTALAATFDTELVHRIGVLLGVETRSKGARVLLGPTINIHRTPIGGRNFECMSEDPTLTSDIAVAVVQGIQSQGVAACAKHFVGNDTEFERMTIDSQIDETTLREIYLAPFEAVVRRAGAKAIMTGYNRLNGQFCADDKELITNVLRGEWGFDGIVMSDWFGLHSTVEGVLSGLDLEMPGPVQHRGKKLEQAVEQGLLSIDDLKPLGRRMLQFLDWTGAFEDGEPGLETTRDDPADRSFLREAAAASMVLLRNEHHALPLAAPLKKVAVIGPNALPGQIMGGGSAFVNAVHWSAPLRSIEARIAEQGDAEVTYARGCLTHRQLPHPARDLYSAPQYEYFANGLDAYRAGEQPTRTEAASGFRAMWMMPPSDDVPIDSFGCVVRSTFTPDLSGTWTLGVTSVGDSRVLIDGAVVIADAGGKAGGSYFGTGKSEHRATIDLEAGRAYELTVEYQRTDMGLFAAFNVGALAPVTTNLLLEATGVAATSDVSIVIVGTNDDWESEGYDRAVMDLPGDQDQLIREVAQVSKQTIVVVNAGSPVSMPWLNDVDAVLYTWFPGQEFGDALADVLFGDVEPGGRLPVTMPRRLEDTPAGEHYPGRNGAAPYREGRLVGYRWYDTIGKQPLFPFGFGLGYSSTQMVSAAMQTPSSVRVTVTNTGNRATRETVQIYTGVEQPETDQPSSRDQPIQRLSGFARTPLIEPGESTDVVIKLDERSFQQWSVAEKGWADLPGSRVIKVGTSSRDLPIELRI